MPVSGERLRPAFFPVSQIVSAGTALVAWLIIGAKVDPTDQEIAIASYAIGAPVGLVASLGIAYLLPNLFRGAALGPRGNSGPWSRPTRIAILSCAVCYVAGIVLLSFSQWRTAAVSGSALVVAAVLGLSVLVAQIGRSVDSLGLTVLGLCGAPTVSLAWLAALSFVPQSHAAFVAAALMSAWVLVQLALLVPFVRSAGRGVSESGLLSRSLPLVPHLLFFGLLMQGVRAVALVDGDAVTLSDAHNLMLIISIGMTLLASINGYLSPKLQASSEADLAGRLDSSMTVYAVSGIAAAAVTVIAYVSMASAGVIRPAASDTAGMVAYCVIAASAYYSISSQFLRDFSTVPLAISSGAAAGGLLLPGVFLDIDLDDALVCFSASMTILVGTLMLVGFARGSRRSYRLVGVLPMVLCGIAAGLLIGLT